MSHREHPARENNSNRYQYRVTRQKKESPRLHASPITARLSRQRKSHCPRSQSLLRSLVHSLTYLLSQPNMSANRGLFISYWSDDLPLPNNRKARRRGHGRGVQSRGPQAWPFCCPEIPAPRSSQRFASSQPLSTRG